MDVISAERIFMRLKVISVGYEQRSVPDLIALLGANKVHKLLDVRQLPLSRKKGFSKTSLSQRLDEAGIEYIHIKEAGNPHRKLKADLDMCLSLYEDYLNDHAYVLELVEAEINSGAVAILCYEREHCNCHRSVLLDKMKRRNRSLRIIEV